jgi:hypothetical protein
MTRVIALVIGLLLMGPGSVLVATDTTPPCHEGRPPERGGGRRCNSNGAT